MKEKAAEKMQELIKINVNEDGKQLVSARELYLGLGLNKAAWSRWAKKNIQESEYFNEGCDFIGVQHDVEGNVVQDFAITLEFAKHIAMMARTKKSHQYRNYFIECEKKVQAIQYPKLSKELQAIFSIDAKQQELDGRITTLEERMTIETGKQKFLCDLVNKRVVSVLGGKDTPAYRELGKKAFRQCWNDFKKILDVASYKDTPVKDFDFAKKVIIDWQPNRELELMIKGCNAQIRM
jgi:anti-repressor protein